MLKKITESCAVMQYRQAFQQKGCRIIYTTAISKCAAFLLTRDGADLQGTV